MFGTEKLRGGSGSAAATADAPDIVNPPVGLHGHRG
jgi:hypothetical protein